MKSSHYLPLAFAAGVFSTAGQVLYDPNAGTLPTAQGWSYLALPIPASLALLDGSTQLGTMASSEILAGFARVAPVPLDRSAGFTLHFQVRLVDENHADRVDRAGLSVTILSSDRMGIELGFWLDRIWAQSDSPLFTHAEESGWDTAAFTDYALTMQGQTYSLTANGGTLLTGPVRDYTSFEGVIDPYDTPDFLFVGDNTTSAGAAIELRTIKLELMSTEPPPLEIILQGDGSVRFSWAITESSWTLVSADRLDSLGWSSVSEPVQSDLVRNYVTISAARELGFFRLRRE